MKGAITVIDKGRVKVHSYMAPDDSLNVTTQLIETPARVIVVDAQYALDYAHEVAGYARELNKPIDRVIVTHAHPDHFNGSAVFGAPVHALAGVRDAIAALGDGPDPSGAIIRATSLTPTDVIAPGTETIDGVRFEFEAVSGGEAPEELLIRLPDQGVLVAQDLIYHGIHLFVGQNDISRWQVAVRKLAAMGQYDTVLAGHGLPSDQKVFAEMLEYLAAAHELLAGADANTYKAAIIGRFPNHGGTPLIDISTTYLFAAQAT